MKNLIKIIWNTKSSDAKGLTKAEYDSYLASDDIKLKAAYEKAWDSKKFEIENYWKRATYFWSFLVPAFAGYFALVNSDNYKTPDNLLHIETFLIICVGFVMAVAWALVNNGSKAWQRNWEIHVDLLEDRITGPLYQIVAPVKTYSVSKINEIVSWFIVIVWAILAYKYKEDQGLEFFLFSDGEINLIVSLSFSTVCFIMLAMVKGYGRGRFTNREVTMSKRSTTYVDP